MQILIQSVIYLLAVFGIIFTTMSFFEMYIYNSELDETDEYNKYKNKSKYVEIIVNMKGLTKDEETKIIEAIKRR